MSDNNRLLSWLPPSKGRQMVGGGLVVLPHPLEKDPTEYEVQSQYENDPNKGKNG